MNDIKNIAREAEKALSKIKNGKTFPGSYVVARLEGALEIHPRDALIGHMRDVFAKLAQSKGMITQREIAQTYDHLYGMSGGRSKFREVAGDLLPDSHASIQLTTGAAERSRIPYDKALEPMYESTKLSKELSGVFSLDKKGSFSAFSENTIKKAEKFTKIQLTSMGCVPQEVRAVKSNDHFVLCKASVDTSDFTQVEVSVPVQVTNGIPALPAYFVQEDGLVKLNKENLYVFVKDKNNFKKKVARDSYAAQRSFGELKSDSPVVPSSLEAYANIEDSLVEAASDFSRDQIALARNVLASQMSGFGIPNPQIKVAASNSKTLTFTSSIPTNKGRVDITVPVDMPNGSPVMPSKFSVAGETFSMNEGGLRRVIDGVNNNSFETAVSREVEAMQRLSYDQLLGEVTSGVSRGDLKLSEDALGVIQHKFGGQKYISALDTFSRLLKHASQGSDRDALIKEAFDRGDLIRVPTSVQLYCPKLGLPVSKVAFDSNGKPVPAARKINTEPLQDSGAMISNSKIVLS
tara:strand:- start:2695 stop:4254 length:1560 start_codon:yes stop_codon:yes gene_type:complete